MRMRTTNSMITNRFMFNMNSNLSRMERLNNQLAANRKIVRLSDDPVGMVTAMESRSRLHRIEQYDKNVGEAIAWNEQVETNIQDMIKNVVTAYEKVVQISSDAKTASDKQATGELIKQLRDEILTLANSTLGDRFIFGGYNTMVRPFEFDETVGDIGQLLYNGLDMSDTTSPGMTAAWQDQMSDELQFELGFGNLTMEVSFTGCKVLGLGENNIFGILNELYHDLQKTDVPNPAYFPLGDPGYQSPYQDNVAGPPFVIANPLYQGEYYPKINPDWRPEGHADHQPQTIYDADGNAIPNPLYEPKFLDGQIETDPAIVGGMIDAENRSNNYEPELLVKEATGPELAAYIPRLQAAQNHLLAIEGEIGGRTNRYEMMQARYEEDFIIYTERKSMVEDIDQAETITQYKMAETVYRTTLAAGARIIQPTLMDFLR